MCRVVFPLLVVAVLILTIVFAIKYTQFHCTSLPIPFSWCNTTLDQSMVEAIAESLVEDSVNVTYHIATHLVKDVVETLTGLTPDEVRVVVADITNCEDILGSSEAAECKAMETLCSFEFVGSQALLEAYRSTPVGRWMKRRVYRCLMSDPCHPSQLFPDESPCVSYDGS